MLMGWRWCEIASNCFDTLDNWWTEACDGRCLGKLIPINCGKIHMENCLSSAWQTVTQREKKSEYDWVKRNYLPAELTLSRLALSFIHIHSTPTATHSGLLSEKLLIESHHAWIRRKIALKFSLLLFNPNVTNKMISIHDEKGFCVVNERKFLRSE